MKEFSSDLHILKYSGNCSHLSISVPSAPKLKTHCKRPHISSWPPGTVVSYPFVLSIDLPDLLIRLHSISHPVLFLHLLLLQWWLLLYHPLCACPIHLQDTYPAHIEPENTARTLLNPDETQLFAKLRSFASQDNFPAS